MSNCWGNSAGRRGAHGRRKTGLGNRVAFAVQALSPQPAQPPESVLARRQPERRRDAAVAGLGVDQLHRHSGHAILRSKELPDEAGTSWVAVDAQLRYRSVTSHATQAGVLGGAIASDHLAGTARRRGAQPARYLARNLPWPSGAYGRATPCIFLGLAGIGRVHVRLAEPELPSVLLVRTMS